MAKTNEPKLTIKNYRSAGIGRDGEMYSCTLYVDGKKAALCREEGRGGEMDIDWSPSGGFRFRPGPVGERVLAHVASMPLEQTEYGPMKRDLAMVVAELVDEAEAEKKIKRWCKKWIVALTPDTQRGQFTIWKRMAPTSANMTRLRVKLDSQYGAGTYEIVNDRYVA